MESFLDRIGKLPHKKLTLLAAELYQRSLSAGGAAEPVAITAMACRFPGGYPDACDTPEAFWSFLNHSGDAIGQIPEERLAMTGTVRADLTGKGASWGAFLPGVSESIQRYSGSRPGKPRVWTPSNVFCWRFAGKRWKMPARRSTRSTA